MAEKRQFELLLLRLVSHALRDDFMTVGVVVLEDSRQESAVSSQLSALSYQRDRFAAARFTRDWKRVECFAPDFELEVLERLEAAVRGRLKEIRRREDLLQLLEEEFGTVFDVGPVKALIAEDPVAEMGVLERVYLAPMERAERERRLGRMGIVGRMEDAFAGAGVLEFMQRDIEMSEFTGKDDPFRVDFGFRVGKHPSKPQPPQPAKTARVGDPGSGLLGTPGKTLKMFQGLALNLSREPAVALAYRYARIQSGMRTRGEEALMTAIVSEEAMRRRGEVASGIAMLRTNEVEVRGVEEMAEVAERVRREVTG